MHPVICLVCFLLLSLALAVGGWLHLLLGALVEAVLFCARGRGGMGDDHADDAPHALAVVVPRGDLFLVHAGRGRRARAGCVGGVGADGGRPRTGRLAYRRARLDGGDGGAAAAFHAPRATLRRAALVDRAAGPVRRVARTRGGAGGLDARRGRGGAKRSARDGAARGTATHAVDALG